jgi:hypothetical protein
MVYTCFEMVRDCRADSPEGWRYFASVYVPMIRGILARYASGAGDEAERVERVLLTLRHPGCVLFQTGEASPERWLVGELRQMIMAELPTPQPEIPLDLETVAEALASLTATEKQAAWFETMHYDSTSAGALMRVAPATVDKIRARASELIRGKVDHWNRSMLADNGLALGREAAAAPGKDCLPIKAFLDILDGRTTWREKEALERHVNTCWHCVDHYARMQEVMGLLRSCQPYNDQEAAPYRKILGVADERRPVWKRLLGAR